MNHTFVAGGGPGAVSFSYGHDAAGKTTTIGISQPAFEWMPSLSYATTYGAANVLNQIGSAGGVGIGWTLDGNMSTDGVNTYTWSYGNRMIGANRSGMTATYDYDSDDRRTRKTVNGVVTRTMWSGADELAEYDVNGDLIRRFVPDGTMDADGNATMDARLATVTPAGEVYWHHTDHQGSVVATSNSAGQTIGTASYSPYGEFGAGVSAPPQHSPFGYTGRQYDVETGLYQYRARFYSPSLGQFLSMDPIGTKGDPNLYLYVGLDPVNATDPTGLCPCIVSMRRYDYHALVVVTDTATGEEMWARGGPTEGRGLSGVSGSDQGPIASIGMAVDLVIGSPRNPIDTEVSGPDRNSDAARIGAENKEVHVLGETTIDGDFGEITSRMQGIADAIDDAGIEYKIFSDNSNGVATTIYEETTGVEAPESDTALTRGYGKNFCDSGQASCPN